MLVELAEIGKLQWAEVAPVCGAVPCLFSGLVCRHSISKSAATPVRDHPLWIGDEVAGVMSHHIVVDHLAVDSARACS